MNIKKITAAVMTVTILAGMTACSDTANETAEVSETTEVTTTIAETTTTAETTAAAEETTTVTEETTIEETEISDEPEDEGFSQEQQEITELIVPDGTVKIEDGAYSHYFSLTDVTIPDGVTEIGKNAFRQCYELTNINIPDSVNKIGAAAFYGDESLKSIEIPANINEIGEQAFAYSALTGEIVIKGDNCVIGNGAFFSCIKLESVIIKDGVTKIGGTAFADCESLKSVVIPDSVTEIGDGAFKNCVNLTNITVPDKFNDRYEDIFGYKLALSPEDVIAELYEKDGAETVEYYKSKIAGSFEFDGNLCVIVDDNMMVSIVNSGTMESVDISKNAEYADIKIVEGNGTYYLVTKCVKGFDTAFRTWGTVMDISTAEEVAWYEHEFDETSCTDSTPVEELPTSEEYDSYADLDVVEEVSQTLKDIFIS